MASKVSAAFAMRPHWKNECIVQLPRIERHLHVPSFQPLEKSGRRKESRRLHPTGLRDLCCVLAVSY
eukprot:scaffold4066_cov417-Prasinococcus_capsulatus_cf.AAC.10